MNAQLNICNKWTSIIIEVGSPIEWAYIETELEELKELESEHGEQWPTMLFERAKNDGRIIKFDSIMNH